MIDSSNKDRIIWFKDELIKAEEAKVNILSPTAQYGLNVFEGLRGYWSEEHNDLFIFRLDDHLKRLQRSCQILGIRSPYDSSEITKAIIKTLHANTFRCDVSIRVTLFVDEEGGSWSSSNSVNLCTIMQVKTGFCQNIWEEIRNLTANNIGQTYGTFGRY